MHTTTEKRHRWRRRMAPTAVSSHAAPNKARAELWGHPGARLPPTVCYVHRRAFLGEGLTVDHMPLEVPMAGVAAIERRHGYDRLTALGPGALPRNAGCCGARRRDVIKDYSVRRGRGGARGGSRSLGAGGVNYKMVSRSRYGVLTHL